MIGLDAEERKRFERQLPLLREEGQQQLKAAKVAVVGIGGLGSAAALYLAAAGVGGLVLVDYDNVDTSNLNRQILHTTQDLGKRKVDSAAAKLGRLYPSLEATAQAHRITRDNAEHMLQGVHAIVDGLDNFPSRLLLSDYAFAHRLPLFHGAVWGWEGRATTIVPGETPCLRCLYPNVSDETQTVPVIGVAPALIGVVQATEVVKYLTGTGELLLSRLLIYDGEALEFTIAPLDRNPGCPVCGRPLADT